MLASNVAATRDCIDCDVVIVGGSITGNYLASLIAGKGFAVHVIEEHASIGLPMKCAGIVSSKLLRLMQVPPGVILNRIAEARVFGPREQSVTITIKDQPLVLDRTGFDKHFMELARNKGVMYHSGEKVLSITRESSRIVVATPNASYRVKLIVGCDGAHSVVGRYVGITNEFITGKQSIFMAIPGQGAISVDSRACELYFDPSWNDLFAWVIPLSNNWVRAGLATKNHVANQFSMFFKKRFGSSPEDCLDEGRIQELSFTGGTIPIGLPKRCAFDRLLLVGDAACHVKASTGGGIVMSTIAARHAARAILLAFKQDAFSARFLKKTYENRVRKQLGFTLKMHLAIHEGIKHLTEKDYDFLFDLAMQPAIQRALERVADMDFPVPFIVRLLGYPAFYSWLAKFFLRDARFLLAVLGILIFSKAPRS
ncbi:MAG TPA: NAD(P)/FAD-dependent oxidoreductase [Candidatus Lokiarchaeia archaeon]|nr:NAD(P)/FAD-dependent oxidoreductase [Candidatus Lokiarchaeia archaeon]